MFVAFPLEKKSSEAAGSNTALGAFFVPNITSRGKSCYVECYLSSAQIYAGFFTSARKSFNEFTSPIDNCNKFA